MIFLFIISTYEYFNLFLSSEVEKLLKIIIEGIVMKNNRILIIRIIRAKLFVAKILENFNEWFLVKTHQCAVA